MRETDPAEIIIGVDTHKQTHAAVAINGLGARLGVITLPASLRGYQELETWAQSFGPVRAFGIEGTGSYGAGLIPLPAGERPRRHRGQPAQSPDPAPARQE